MHLASSTLKLDASRKSLIDKQEKEYKSIEQEAIQTLNKGDRFDIHFNLMNERLLNHHK
jgi:hypothetical protein